MMPWFHYWSSCRGAESRDESICVFFLADSGTSDLGLLQPFIEEFISQRTPSHLLFISTMESREALGSMLRSEEFSLRLKGGAAALHHPSASHWSFSKTGRLECVGVITGERPHIDEKLLLHDGLLDIFHKRVGLLEAPSNTHYVKPSGKHSAAFIRAGDVLVTDSETIFVASSLVRLVPGGSLQHILCDTSSIAVLGYALKSLGAVRGTVKGTPRIHTFQSYKGVKTLSLTDPDSTFILISASTSGDLAKLVIDQTGITARRVVTLFYRGPTSSCGVVLCDVAVKGTRYKAIPEIGSYSAHDCPLCREGRERVWILGDQFEARSAEASLKLVTVDDAPKWLSRFIQESHGKGIISCHKLIREGGQPRELFFDFSPLYQVGTGKVFGRWENRLDRFLNQGVPAALKRIVFLPDKASTLLAQKVASHLEKALGRKRKIAMLSSAELRSGKPGFELSEGATLVVASAAMTGRSLLAVSQRLRDVQQNDAVGYLVGICRTRTREEFTQLQSNLAFGRTGPNEHPFVTLETIFVPDGGSFRRTPWVEEEKMIQKALDGWVSSENTAVNIIQKRWEQLNKAAGLNSNGLIDNLFLPTLSGKPLRLRRFFAFFDFPHKMGSVAQADVYFVITSILHHLRSQKRESGGIENNVYHRTLLAPRTFDRFNDGAIQAAFLRAAHPEETDYRLLPAASADMREIIETVFQNARNATGEACLEFVLALASEKLRLAESDEILLRPSLDRLSEQSHDCAALIKQMK